jgi:hypothetical protein
LYFVDTNWCPAKVPYPATKIFLRKLAKLEKSRPWIEKMGEAESKRVPAKWVDRAGGKKVLDMPFESESQEIARLDREEANYFKAQKSVQEQVKETSAELMERIAYLMKTSQKVDCWNPYRYQSSCNEGHLTPARCAAPFNIKKEERDFAKLIIARKTAFERKRMELQWLDYMSRLCISDYYPPGWWMAYRSTAETGRECSFCPVTHCFEVCR